MLRRSLSSLMIGVLVAIVAVVNAAPASADTDNPFQLVGTTLCLDGYVGHFPDDVYITGCNGGNFQLWRWGGSTAAQTRLQSRATGKCAQQAGLAADLATCHSTATAQRWYVRGLSTSTQIQKAGTNLCLARTGPDDVGLRACNDTSYQRFWNRRLP